MSLVDETQPTMAAPALSLVPAQHPVVRAGMLLADFALELRAAGRRCEMAEEALYETPHGMTRSATMSLLLHQDYEGLIKQFDRLAADYMEAKMMAARG